MPLYQYIVKDKEGRRVKGIEEASSKKELVEKLKRRDYFIISLEELGEKERRGVFRERKRYTLKHIDLVFFARNLAISLAAGLPLVRSLEVLSHQTESVKLSKVLQGMVEDIKRGLSLSEALSKFPDVFSPLWRGMIEVGEASGNLIFTLEKLADYLELRCDFERKIKSFLIYPIILLIVATLVVFFFFYKILPKFNEIFSQFNIDLPLPTQILFKISDFLRQYFWLVFIIFFIFIFLFLWGRERKEVRIIWDKWNLNLPLLKGLIKLIYLERFASLMYILLESGVPIVYTLEVVSKSIGNIIFEEKIDYLKEEVRRGKNLSSGLAKIPLFPPLLSEITQVGEEAGNLSQMFEKLSTYYQKELSARIERLVYILEPVMIVIMAIIVGTIVISLFWPLFKLTTLGA